MHAFLASLFSVRTNCILATFGLGICGANAISADSASPAPVAGIQPQVEVEGRVRSEAADANVRLAIPVWRAVEHGTLLQASASKGEESLGGVSAGVIQRFRPSGGNWVFGL